MVFPPAQKSPRTPCRRCGTPTHPERLIKGYGRSCADLLGLTGSTADTGHEGPDLLDLLDDMSRTGVTSSDQPG
jgi:hypothetical protein